MSCIPIPHVPTPTLPFPLTIGLPPLPGFSGEINLCCKILAIDIPPLPLPIPPLMINPAVVEVIKSTIATINAYIDKLPFDCPLE